MMARTEQTDRTNEDRPLSSRTRHYFRLARVMRGIRSPLWLESCAAAERSRARRARRVELVLLGIAAAVTGWCLYQLFTL